jgi:hypothetical protein
MGRRALLEECRSGRCKLAALSLFLEVTLSGARDCLRGRREALDLLLNRDFPFEFMI